jgi:hypothetical protein
MKNDIKFYWRQFLRRLPLMMAIIILFTAMGAGPGRTPAGRLRERGAASGGIAADFRRPRHMSS